MLIMVLSFSLPIILLSFITALEGENGSYLGILFKFYLRLNLPLLGFLIELFVVCILIIYRCFNLWLVG